MKDPSLQAALVDAVQVAISQELRGLAREPAGRRHGVHALGWSRAQAGKLLLEHTALAPENIRSEVDRDIAWPGQPGLRDR